MGHYLEFKGIKKAFPGVQALGGVSFRAEGGRILALLGENGAGKSTLLKILAGDYLADEGELILDGQMRRFSSPHEAIVSGISVVYQERQIMPAMTVMENIYAGALPKNKLGLIDKPRLKKDARELIEKFGLPIEPSELVGRLSVAHQQMVEIIKTYQRGSTVIAFDEPTASLTESCTDASANRPFARRTACSRP